MTHLQPSVVDYMLIARTHVLAPPTSLCPTLSLYPSTPWVTLTSALVRDACVCRYHSFPMIPCSLLTVLLFSLKVWHTWWWATKVWAISLFLSFLHCLLCSHCPQSGVFPHVSRLEASNMGCCVTSFERPSWFSFSHAATFSYDPIFYSFGFRPSPLLKSCAISPHISLNYSFRWYSLMFCMIMWFKKKKSHLH